ncbi:MAG: pyridoxal-dependent decarboxylase [Candidatus Dormibacteraeota bacterium]|nr:pyridoxal-dependent decarboxylase [Candidatus Dormibacteraeota bacterium]
MLQLEIASRTRLWRDLAAAIDEYINQMDSLPVWRDVDPADVRAFVEKIDFEMPSEPTAALRFAVEGLTRYQMHFSSPRYFGLFDPAPSTMSIAADALVAAINPQLAAWIGSPFGVEIERRLIRLFGERFGYLSAATDGTFTSGGAEANHTALLTALVDAFPQYAAGGARALPGQPVLYLSEEGHPSVVKAARVTGLGEGAVRRLPVDHRLRLRPAGLVEAIARDRAQGLAPFMIVATAGTTSSGSIDPLEEIAAVAATERLWLHVDGAWGGGAAFVPELRPALAGIERADSISFDPHKLLSVSMGAGLYLTRHPQILEKTFHTGAPYLPEPGELVNPYTHSLQWSRRFIGLKVWLSLAVAGWDGYAAVLRHQIAMGERLRNSLQRAGWEIVNATPLPLVCFVDPGGVASQQIVDRVNATGRSRLFTTTISPGRSVVRACITNFRTGPGDIDELVQLLEESRRRSSDPKMNATH